MTPMQLTRIRMSRTPLTLLALALAVTLAACGARAPTDSMEAARNAIEMSADAEPCAEAEYRAAANLLEQAEEAFASRDYARARQLADAATLQAERARQTAIANAEDCDRMRNMTEEVEEVQADRNTNAVDADPDYEFVAVYFDFDQAALTEDMRRTLNAHSDQMIADDRYLMRIEGHCDRLGSTEYNLALGDRRARSVKDYLVRRGVPAGRVSTLSYGAELPISSRDRENRRAEFRVRQ